MGAAGTGAWVAGMGAAGVGGGGRWVRLGWAGMMRVPPEARSSSSPVRGSVASGADAAWSAGGRAVGLRRGCRNWRSMDSSRLNAISSNAQGSTAAVTAAGRCGMCGCSACSTPPAAIAASSSSVISQE